MDDDDDDDDDGMLFQERKTGRISVFIPKIILADLIV